MIISNKMRTALLEAVNNQKNTTGSSHIPFSRYTDKTGTYVFAVMCQKMKE